MDVTSWWVFLKTRGDVLGKIVVAILLFAAGWQLGRAMSPYYAAHPIVFEESASSVAQVAADEQALVAVRDEGVALRQSKTSPTPAIAGAVVVNSTNEPVADKLFVASAKSTKYHHRDCSTWKQIKEENRVWFSTQAEAEAAGYEPTQCTAEKLKAINSNSTN